MSAKEIGYKNLYFLLFLNEREKRSAQNNCEDLSAIMDRILEQLNPSQIELLYKDIHDMTGLHFINWELMVL